MIETDASAYQVGAVLLQQQDPDNPREWVPIGFWSNSLTAAERNYLATARECLSVVWSITTMRPYIEGLHFAMRKDHDALRWLLTISDSTGRLMHWRLRLSEFDFPITYRPVLVHEVPDALSRIIAPRGAEPTQVDDEVSTYGNREPVLITTRARSASEQQRIDSARAEKSVEGGDAIPDSMEDVILDKVLEDEIDDLDIELAEKDASPEPIAVGPLAFTPEDLVEGQKEDAFSQTVLSRQSKRLDSLFFEDR